MKSVRWRWGVDGMVIYFISLVAQDVRESPVVRQEGRREGQEGRRGFREEYEIRCV